MTGALVGIAMLVAGSALADPKPKPVDIKPFKSELIVLQDAQGGIYVVKPGADALVFFGTPKLLYQQQTTGRSADGAAWSISTWAPRIPGIRPADVRFNKDGTYLRSCAGDEEMALTQLTGDKAKAILDKAQFQTEYLMRRPHLLARDDAGVYYYVDRLTKDYGGKGYRVFVGKKGALKQLALVDVASDTAGEVFSTKSGDLRLARGEQASGGSGVTWIKGEKRSALIPLDVDANSPLIFSELGIYKFLGTLCDNI
ncbi:MAG TPA: hypothetical protein VFQ53_17615 [Kofleriaceae bacterium]|nr:hypothetical protein [Kofleriaceae bacterium]